MHKIDTPGSINGAFAAGNPIAGVKSTIVGADWPNAVQDEIVEVIEAEGFGLDKTNNAQLRAAIQSMIDGGSSPVGWLNVQTDFLARGNGSVDDTIVIQAAIDSATVSGGTLYFPRGTYRVTSVLILKPNVTIIGDGRKSIIDFDHDGNGVDIQASATGCRITNMAFAGRAAISPVTERGALRILGGVTDCYLDHLWFDDVVNCGIVFAASATTVNVQTDSIQIDGTGQHGILVKGDPRRLTFSNIIAENIGQVSGGVGNGVGLKIDEAQDVQILNVYCATDATNGAHGIVIGPDAVTEAVARVLMSNCVGICNTSTATDAGILIQNDVADLVVSCSKFSGPLGIKLDGTGSADRPFQVQLSSLHATSTDATAVFALEIEWAEEVYVQAGFYKGGLATGHAVGIGANASHVFLDGLYSGDKADASQLVFAVNTTTYVDRTHHRGTGLLGNSLKVIPASTQQSLSILPIDDTTPTVLGKETLRTANTVATLISNFDDGEVGQEILVLVNDANTTLDFSASSLKGNNGVDWAVPNGESFRAIYDGASWWVQKQA